LFCFVLFFSGGRFNFTNFTDVGFYFVLFYFSWFYFFLHCKNSFTWKYEVFLRKFAKIMKILPPKKITEIHHLCPFNPIYIYIYIYSLISFTKFCSLTFKKKIGENFNISASNWISIEVVKVLTRVILWYLGSFDRNEIICGKMLKS
jgi:hypothetical protein